MIFPFFNMRWFFSFKNASMLMGLYIHQPCNQNHILGIIFFYVGELAQNITRLGGFFAKVCRFALQDRTISNDPSKSKHHGKFQETTQPQQKVEKMTNWMPLPINSCKTSNGWTKSRTPWKLLDLGLFQGWDHQPLQPALKNTNSTQADWPSLKTVEGEKSFAKAPSE